MIDEGVDLVPDAPAELAIDSSSVVERSDLDYTNKDSISPSEQEIMD